MPTQDQSSTFTLIELQNGSFTYDQHADNQNSVLMQSKLLTGRGQAGFAAFYKKLDGSEILIKEDDPATCVMEGTAQFVNLSCTLPELLKNAANYATASYITKEDGTQAVVSVQNKVENSVPLDMLIYGHKRNPKTIISAEHSNRAKITSFISNLTSDLQWQLAAGIFISVACGDESLHVGQFMAIQDIENNIVGIKRIDFGARERYAVSKFYDPQSLDPLHASKQYSSSGQFGKDYINFYMHNDELRIKYLLLCSQKINLQNVKTQHQKILIAQITKLPIAQQQLALDGIMKIINKNADQTTKFKFQSPGDSLESKIQQLAANIANFSDYRNRQLSFKAKDIISFDIENSLKQARMNKTQRESFIKLFNKILNADPETQDQVYFSRIQKGLKLLHENIDLDNLNNIPKIRKIINYLLNAAELQFMNLAKDNTYKNLIEQYLSIFKSPEDQIFDSNIKTLLDFANIMHIDELSSRSSLSSTSSSPARSSFSDSDSSAVSTPRSPILFSSGKQLLTSKPSDEPKPDDSIKPRG